MRALPKRAVWFSKASTRVVAVSACLAEVTAGVLRRRKGNGAGGRSSGKLAVALMVVLRVGKPGP